MRRLMIGMSQEALAGRIGITFQQVQKYEKGVNRISASRLHEIADVLEVLVSFFFEEAPEGRSVKRGSGANPIPDYVNDFISSRDGLALIRAFITIKPPAFRRSIVHLVEALVGDEDR
jgi:transcriptional regulator with XRE-family HTH domain